MRSLVGFLVFVTLLVGVLAVAVVPLVAQPLIASLVRDAVPFDGPPLAIEVDAGTGLLSGTVDRISVRGSGLSSGQASVETLDLEVERFAIVGRSFADLRGSLGGVVVVLDDGTTLAMQTVELAGPSDAVTATARFDAAATERLVRTSLAGSGIVPDRVVLGDGTLTVEARGLEVSARPEVRGGALVLVPDQLLPPVEVLAPDDRAPWRLASATITPAGLTLVADVDAEGLLGR